jgi:hypothetical protein
VAADRTRVQDVDVGDASADHAAFEPAAHDLDLRQLRHVGRG